MGVGICPTQEEKFWMKLLNKGYIGEYAQPKESGGMLPQEINFLGLHFSPDNGGLIW